jgi:transcriptional regulator with XRE-family HTH domain
MTNLDYKNITNSLRKFRKTNGYSQKRVAVLLGSCDTGMISRWENGSHLPSPVNMFRLAALYQTTVEALHSDLILVLRREMQAEREGRQEKEEEEKEAEPSAPASRLSDRHE